MTHRSLSAIQAQTLAALWHRQSVIHIEAGRYSTAIFAQERAAAYHEIVRLHLRDLIPT